MLSDTLSNLDKLNHGELSKYQLIHKKITRRMFIYYISKTNRFKTVSARYNVVKMLSDTLSDLDKLNHGEFSKYQL